MANYMCASRTNRFRVTDANKLRKIVESIACEDHVELWHYDDDSYAFGAYGTITELYDEETDEYTPVAPLLQEILPDGEAVVIFEAGNEKLRYVVGIAIIITNKTIEIINLEQEVSEVLHANGYNTEFWY